MTKQATSKKVIVRRYGITGLTIHLVGFVRMLITRLTLRATEEDTHMADPPPYPGTPRWVKVFGIIVIVVVLLVVIVVFSRGHTPPVQHGS